MWCCSVLSSLSVCARRAEHCEWALVKNAVLSIYGSDMIPYGYTFSRFVEHVQCTVFRMVLAFSFASVSVCLLDTGTSWRSSLAVSLI